MICCALLYVDRTAPLALCLLYIYLGGGTYASHFDPVTWARRDGKFIALPGPNVVFCIAGVLWLMRLLVEKIASPGESFVGYAETIASALAFGGLLLWSGLVWWIPGRLVLDPASGTCDVQFSFMPITKYVGSRQMIRGLCAVELSAGNPRPHCLLLLWSTSMPAVCIGSFSSAAAATDRCRELAETFGLEVIAPDAARHDAAPLGLFADPKGRYVPISWPCMSVRDVVVFALATCLIPPACIWGANRILANAGVTSIVSVLSAAACVGFGIFTQTLLIARSRSWDAIAMATRAKLTAIKLTYPIVAVAFVFSWAGSGLISDSGSRLIDAAIWKGAVSQGWFISWALTVGVLAGEWAFARTSAKNARREMGL